MMISIENDRDFANAGTVPITLLSTHTALYVTLTTLAQGRFSDNAFIAWGELDRALLRKSLRVESLSDYANV